jgi:hypothetical protein
MEHKDNKKQREIAKERVGDLENLQFAYMAFQQEEKAMQDKVTKDQ